MSSERRVRIPPTENLRFPEEGSSTQGQSGPKPRTKVVGDGQQAKDSCTTESRLSEVGTQKDRQSTPLVERVQASRGIRQANPFDHNPEALRGGKYSTGSC